MPTGWKPRPTRVYTSREAAEGRFRLAPEQPCENQFILDYIAEHSVREIAKGANPGAAYLTRLAGHGNSIRQFMFVLLLGAILTPCLKQLRFLWRQCLGA